MGGVKAGGAHLRAIALCDKMQRQQSSTCYQHINTRFRKKAPGRDTAGGSCRLSAIDQRLVWSIWSATNKQQVLTGGPAHGRPPFKARLTSMLIPRVTCCLCSEVRTVAAEKSLTDSTATWNEWKLKWKFCALCCPVLSQLLVCHARKKICL